MKSSSGYDCLSVYGEGPANFLLAILLKFLSKYIHRAHDHNPLSRDGEVSCRKHGIPKTPKTVTFIVFTMVKRGKD